MKKTVLAIILVLLLLLAAAVASAETTTLMVYLCGTDLQDSGCEDIIEMAEAQAGEDVSILILAGGAKEWDLEDLEGNTRTLMTIRNGYFDEDPQDWGQKSMGSAESLEEFLSFGLTEYPADRTIAVLWDHGSGSEGGICFDETQNDDGLTLVEINEVLGNLEQSVPDFHINILGCDACMMATYEMAAMLSHYNIDFFVASEELEPGLGWNYKGFLDMLGEDPDMSDEDLCVGIIETFMDACLADNPDDYMTLSAVKLSEMTALENSMEQFAAVMTGQLQAGNLASVRRGRSRMYTIGSFDDGSWDQVDLGAALDTYAQFDSAKASEAKRCLEKAVIASKQTDNLDTFCGMSILVPQDTTEYFDEYKDGIALTDVIPNWIDFINGYVSQLKGGSYHFTVSNAGQISTDTSLGNNYVSSSGSLFNFMNWNDETGEYSEEETEGAEIAISDGTQGFTATLSQEDLQYLDTVEGMLLMDISEDGTEQYIDLGTMQNNLVDWQTGSVVSLYDGSSPIFGGQIVPMYDQTSNPNSRRSLIPVKLNGEYTYLVVVFPAGSTEGRIVGANAGYDDNGLPIRNMTKLKAGDEIIPVYTLYYAEEDQEELQEMEFDGEAITWEDGMTVTYEDLSDEDDPQEMLFCFVFYDIYGEDTMSEMISFEL